MSASSIVEDLFLAALQKNSPEERAAFLDAACKDDPEVRRRVERLLEAHPKAGSFLEGPSPPAREETAAFVPTGEHVGALIAGRYKLVEPIGEGGMGTVWVAQQTEPIKRFVAVKLIKAGMDSKAVLARFEAERQALALMDHPNIARVLDGGAAADGRPFFVMELVKGVSITHFCDARRLTPRQRLELFVPVCQAIQHAHQKGVIHRDIKPSNVLIALYDDKPVPKVIDFGIAKAAGQTLTDKSLMTGFGAVVGTPEYMSPEQASLNNLDIDTRSDVYSLGVLLYELLAGSPPFHSDELKQAGLFEMLRVVREEEPPRPSTKLSTANKLPSISADRGTEPKKLTGLLRNELDWIVMKALEKDRSRRYETVNGFAADVQRYLAGEAVQAHPPTAGYRLRKFARKHRTALTTAAMVVLLLVAGVAVSAWQAVRATRAELFALANEARANANEETARVNQEQAQEEARKARASSEEAMASFKFIQRLITEAWRKSADGKRSLTLREVLDNAEPLFDSLADQPLVEARIRGFLAWLYWGQDYEASVPHFNRALLLYERALVPDSPEALATRENAAVAHNLNGRYDEAIRLYEELLRLRKTKFGSADLKTEEIMGNLAGMYMAAGKLGQARSQFEEILSLRKTRLGPEHPHTLTAMTHLAKIYLLPIPTQNYPQAIRLNKEALAIQRRKLAAEDPALAETLALLGFCLVYAEKPAEAEPVLRECLAIREKKEPHGWKTFYSKSLLGAALLGQKKYSEAEPLLLAGYEGMKTIPEVSGDEERSNLIGNLQWLVQLYEAMGKKDKADVWWKTLQDTRIAAKSLFFEEFDVRLRQFEKTKDASGCRQIAEMWEKVDPTDVPSLYNAACLRAVTAAVIKQDPKTPSDDTTRLANEQADRAMVWLTKAVAAGFKDTAHIKQDTDLDALRGREDFKKLLAALEASTGKSLKETKGAQDPPKP
ncbi:MAG: protein kinase domain-containing protein [Gemmataceae bacterium]